MVISDEPDDGKYCPEVSWDGIDFKKTRACSTTIVRCPYPEETTGKFFPINLGFLKKTYRFSRNPRSGFSKFSKIFGISYSFKRYCVYKKY